MLTNLQEPNLQQEIPYYNILSASVDTDNLVIGYAREKGKDAFEPSVLKFAIHSGQQNSINTWIEKVLDLAYPKTPRRRRIKVLVNPKGGVGKAQQLYKQEIAPIFTLAGAEVDVEQTRYVGHAREIAQEIDPEAWDVIACASGDGTPHEVFNGLADREYPRRALSKIAVVQLPCGSGNAMSLNMLGTASPSKAALATIKGTQIPLDLVSVTQGEKRYISFLSQAVGIVADSDLGTEKLRWMGAARFEVGFLIRLLGKSIYPAEMWLGVESGDKMAIRQAFRKEASIFASYERPPTDSDDLPPLKFGTVNDDVPADWTHIDYKNLGNFYSGNMSFMTADANFFPYALPCDGKLDLLTCDGDIPRHRAINLLTSLAKNRLWDQPEVAFRKLNGFRIVPKAKTGYISIDGEHVPFEPFQVEVHQGLGTVLSGFGRLYNTQNALL